MRIQFVDTLYQFSHGHTPRGRGSWAFAFDRDGGRYFFVPGSMTFTDAKREASRILDNHRGAMLPAFCPRHGKMVDVYIPNDVPQIVLYVAT